jgi:hypothetical protein
VKQNKTKEIIAHMFLIGMKHRNVHKVILKEISNFTGHAYILEEDSEDITKDMLISTLSTLLFSFFLLSNTPTQA